MWDKMRKKEKLEKEKTHFYKIQTLSLKGTSHLTKDLHYPPHVAIGSLCSCKLTMAILGFLRGCQSIVRWRRPPQQPIGVPTACQWADAPLAPWERQNLAP